MELNLELKLHDVYGGDGITRSYQVEEVKLSRLRTKTQTRKDIGIPIESEMNEQQKELKDTICHTFKREEDGTPILRLGGSHGKIWGIMKEAAGILKDSKGTFASFAEIERFMRTVQIFPIYARLENGGDMIVDALPQILAGRRSSMITQHFDVIPSCHTKIKLVFPTQYENKIRAILTQLQELSCLNKRRGTIEIVS